MFFFLRYGIVRERVEYVNTLIPNEAFVEIVLPNMAYTGRDLGGLYTGGCNIEQLFGPYLSIKQVSISLSCLLAIE